MTTTVLALPGTWNPTGDDITLDFLSHFDSSRYETKVVQYPATFGGTDPAFALSRAAGRQALIDAIAALPADTPIVLAGYSQGAVIAGDLAAEYGREKAEGTPIPNIVAVALIADGFRPPGVGVTPPGESRGLSEGYGIGGARPIPYLGVPIVWASAWGDPICSLPAGSPLRTVADLSEWYSLSSLDAMLRWGADMLDKVFQGRLQEWWNPWKREGWMGALAFARGYLFDGRHTNAYILEDYTRTAAAKVQWLLEG